MTWKPIQSFVRHLLLMGALVLMLAASTATQQPQEPSAPTSPSPELTFRAGVRYIEIDVVVRDRDGGFINGLTKDDFILSEDYKPQTIDRVTTINLPPVRPFARPSTIVEGFDPSAAGSPAAGRIYVMVLEDAGAPGTSSLAAWFIDRYLASNDRIGVVHVNDPERNVALTNDKKRLFAAVQADPEYVPRKSKLDMYQVLKEVAVNLSAVSGRRKSILLFGRGEDLWTPRLGTIGAPLMQDSWKALNDATKTAAGYRVPIHTINSAPYGSDAAAGLSLLAEDTGGVNVRIDALDRGFRRIVEESSRYYILGYYSDVERDGKYHSVQVQVRHPGASVHGRRGFRAMTQPTKGTTVSLPRALSKPARLALTADEVTLPAQFETSAVMFRGEKFDASVLVHTFIKGKDLRFADKDTVQFATVAIDQWGRVRATADRTFTATVGEGLRARIERTGASFLTRLSLPHGSYDIRVIAQHAGQILGTTSTKVEVPDFTDRSLLFSDLLVTASAKAPIVLLPDSALRQVLSTAPMFVRRFTVDDNLDVFGEIYDTHYLLSPRLGVRWHILSADGGVVANGEGETRSSNGRAYFKGRVPLNKLAPGTYVLEAEAFTVSGMTAAATQQLEFEILPKDGL